MTRATSTSAEGSSTSSNRNKEDESTSPSSSRKGEDHHYLTYNNNNLDQYKVLTGELRLQSIETVYSSDINQRYLQVPDKYTTLEELAERSGASGFASCAMTSQHHPAGKDDDDENHKKDGTCGNPLSPKSSVSGTRNTKDSSSCCSSSYSGSELIGTSVDIHSGSPESPSSTKDSDASSFYYSATSTDSGIVLDRKTHHLGRHHHVHPTSPGNKRHRIQDKESSIHNEAFFSNEESCKFNDCAATIIDLHVEFGNECRTMFQDPSLSSDGPKEKLTPHSPELPEQTLPTYFLLPLTLMDSPDTDDIVTSPESYKAKQKQFALYNDEDDNSSGRSDHSEMVLSHLVASSVSDNANSSNDSMEDLVLDTDAMSSATSKKKHVMNSRDRKPSSSTSMKILHAAQKKASMIQEQLLRSQEDTTSGFLLFLPPFLRPGFRAFESPFLDSLCNDHKQPNRNKSTETDSLSPGDEIRIINHLYSAIRSHKSLEALAHLEKNPDDAKVWVTCYDTLSPAPDAENLMPVKLLPLHTACLSQSPVILVKKILDAYPDAVRKRAGNAKYPIHLACEANADPAVVSLLLEYWPEALFACDGQGNIPLTNLVQSTTPMCRTKVENMKLILEALEINDKAS